MTSPTDDEPQAERASADDEAAVRRLLADARATGPVPSEVAARLDATLAGLVADRDAGREPTDERPAERTAAVVPLASRRRRTAAGLLVAAAAVVVGGVAIGESLDSGSGNDSSPAAGSAVDRGDNANEAPADAAQENDDGLVKRRNGMAAGTTEDMTAALRIKPPKVAPPVRADRLQADLEWLQLEKLDGVRRGYYLDTVVVLPAGFHCAPGPWGAGIHFGVRYDGRAAMAAYRLPQGDNQVVDVLQCDTADVLRSTTLPSRVPGR